MTERAGAAPATRPDASPDASPDAPTRLRRQLGVGDAVVVGLGAMLGAGVFAAVAPAAQAAGPALLVGLAIAAVVAWLNATSVARLAGIHPESGGAYAYGRARLGPAWGFLAGAAFVAGKTASCAAMAMTFAHHAAPASPRWAALAAVVSLTVVNLLGVQKTAWATRVVVTVVLGVLALVVVACLAGGTVDVERLRPTSDTSVRGVLEASGILFFAFAGYARIATLGEEVREPARTIPRAIPIALGVTLVVYAAVLTSALAAAGAEALASSSAPLALAVSQGSLAAAAPFVRVGAAVASLGVLLSLLAGVGRTAFAMAGNGDLPRALSAVHPRSHVPHRAELVLGTLLATVVLFTDVRGAIGFSSFAVLGYYAIAHAAALAMDRAEGRRPRVSALLGLVGCIVVGLTLPTTSVTAGLGVLGAAGALRLVATLRGRPPAPDASRG